MKVKTTISLLTLVVMFLGAMTVQAQVSYVDPNPATQTYCTRTEFNDAAATTREALTNEVFIPNPLDPTAPFTANLWNGSGSCATPGPGLGCAQTNGTGYLRAYDSAAPPCANSNNVDCMNNFHHPNFFIEPETYASDGGGPDLTVWEVWYRFPALSTGNPTHPRAWWGHDDFNGRSGAANNPQDCPVDSNRTRGWIFGTGQFFGAGLHSNQLGTSVFPNTCAPGGSVLESSMAEFSGVTFSDGVDIGTRIIIERGLDPISPTCLAPIIYEYSLVGAPTADGGGASWTQWAPSGPNADQMNFAHCSSTVFAPTPQGVGGQFLGRTALRTGQTEEALADELLISHASVFEGAVNPAIPVEVSGYLID